MRSSTVPTLPVRGDRRGAEVDAARVRSNSVAVVERELRRAQHHVDQMAAGLGVGEHVAEERALGDLVALLVLLQALALARRPARGVGVRPGTRSAAA